MEVLHNIKIIIHILYQINADDLWEIVPPKYLRIRKKECRSDLLDKNSKFCHIFKKKYHFEFVQRL